MAKIGLNVPPGLTITTDVCQEFYRVGEPAAARRGRGDEPSPAGPPLSL
jgi:phosphoenolpyruvate synthase/pyruvate phosphate dikinase